MCIFLYKCAIQTFIFEIIPDCFTGLPFSIMHKFLLNESTRLKIWIDGGRELFYVTSLKMTLVGKILYLFEIVLEKDAEDDI